MPSFGSTRDLEGNVFDMDNIVQEAVTQANAAIGLGPDTPSGIRQIIPQVEYKFWMKQTLASTGVGNEVVANVPVTAPGPTWTMGPIQIYPMKNWTVDGAAEPVTLSIGNSSNSQRYLANFDIENLGNAENGEYVYTRTPVNTSLNNDQTVNLRVTSKKGRTGTDAGGAVLVVVTLFRP